MMGWYGSGFVTVVSLWSLDKTLLAPKIDWLVMAKSRLSFVRMMKSGLGYRSSKVLSRVLNDMMTEVQ